MPLSLHFDGDEETPGNMMLSLTAPSVQPMATFELLRFSITALNRVLGALIPGMHLEILEYGGQMTPDGKEGMRFEILSVRGENRIPLKNESEGIKKIISILSILIAMYNNPSVCVAVDEFDAGVYEYLLSGKTKEKVLSIRAFTDNEKRTMYERQNGICPMCAAEGKTKHWEIEEMHADHKIPWSRGGHTTLDNGQMLCRDHNLQKSDI